MNYFAYGSNMSAPRLTARVPSARVLGVYKLPEHDLRFHKIGRDGSAKCDAFRKVIALAANADIRRPMGILTRLLNKTDYNRRARAHR